MKENGAYGSFIENCLNDEDTLQSIAGYDLPNIEINNGFTWVETSEGVDYWDNLFNKSCELNIIPDMDEILYKEYEKRNTKESSEQNPITKYIIEDDREITLPEFQTITLNGVDYHLVPKEVSIEYKDIEAETTEEHLKRKFKENKDIYEVLFKEKKSNDWSFCYRPLDLSWRKDWDYKFIKKEHKEIIEAYLKDNTLKVQYRWHDEAWMLLDDFIENYDEDMQLRIAKKEFEPFTLNIKINTIDEAKSLWNRFNLNYGTLCEATHSDYYNVEFENRLGTHKYWNQIDNVLKDFGEEPDAEE